MIQVTSTNGAGQICLAKPEKRNALDIAAYQALTKALSEFQQDPEIHSVVISGAGGHFSAGNDLADFQSAQSPEALQPVLAFIHTLNTFTKPLIASVEGMAVGIGATLLLHCDLVVASPDTQVRFPFSPMGLTVEAGASVLLPATVGLLRAKDWVLTGRFIPAQEALEAGLINQLVDSPEKAAESLQQSFAMQSLPALMANKALLRPLSVEKMTDVINHEAEQFMVRLMDPETQARIGALLQPKSS